MLFGAKISVLALKEKVCWHYFIKKNVPDFKISFLNRFLCLGIKSFDIFLERDLRRRVSGGFKNIYLYTQI